MRQPLEEKKINLSRAQGNFTFPAHFTLVAAMNPCPCGFLGDSKQPCICTSQAIANYQKKISGPIFDRLDLTVKLNRSAFVLRKEPDQSARKELSNIKNSVNSARERQARRFANSWLQLNSQLSARNINQYLKLSSRAEDYLKIINQKTNFSARAFLHLLKTAMTIADLKEKDEIDNIELAEAFQYRQNIFEK